MQTTKKLVTETVTIINIKESHHQHNKKIPHHHLLGLTQVNLWHHPAHHHHHHHHHHHPPTLTKY